MLNGSKIPGFNLLPNNFDVISSGSVDVYQLILSKVKAYKNAWPFLKPVDVNEVNNYYDVILFPIDLMTIGKRIINDYYIHVNFFLN